MLDTSSGASISVRQILLQLHKAGWEIDIVGATVFDDPKGIRGLGETWEAIDQAGEVIVTVNDAPLTHRLIKTQSTVCKEMRMSEADRLYALYIDRLKKFRPDVVFFYGGTSTDFHIPLEARLRGVPSVAYLVNANYQSHRWCRDVDLIITDTKATANFYADRQGFHPVPVGNFIDLEKAIVNQHERKHITLINPSWDKGVGIVALIAMALENRRPDIQFEVVETRSNWNTVVQDVTRSIEGEAREHLRNVIVTANTGRISDVYSRSRIVLGLSQCWESGSHFLAEAMLNGIPAIVSNNAGSLEIVGDGGIVVDLPKKCYEPSYSTLPNFEEIEPLIQSIEDLWDDEIFYLQLMTGALKQGMALHRIEQSTERLISVMKPLVEKRAGDSDFFALLQNVHKHRLTEHVIQSSLKKGSLQETKQRTLELRVNPDPAIKSFLKVDERASPHIVRNELKADLSCVNLIHPGGNWILEKMAEVLKKGLDNAESYDYREIDAEKRLSIFSNPNAINYYINYNLFPRKSLGLDVAWFTHIEEGIPNLKKKFFDVVNAVDFAIFNSPKYKIISGLPEDKTKVIIPGIGNHFFSRNLVLGVVGRDYAHTDRKNTKLVEEVKKLPFVDFRFTGGALADDDLVKFYREIDYVFTASTIEGGPMSLLEGLAAGKKSIFPRDVGLWSEFRDKVITYDHENIPNLILILMRLHARKASLVQSVEAFTWENFVKQHHAVFSKLRENFKRT